MDKLILAVDLGTQSIRAMLFNPKGEMLGKVKESFVPYFSEKEGYAEQRAELYWEKICAATNKLKADKPELWESIIGVTVTPMRDVGICLDKNYKPLRPAILYLDQRKAACKEPLPLKTRLLFRISGMKEVVEKNMVDCKSNWIRENEPEIWENTYKYVQLSAYINLRFTGLLKDSVASSIGHIPMDYKKRTWLPEKHFQMPAFKVPVAKLYELIEPGEILGTITAEASKESGIKEGTPLVAAGSDKGCETIGTGTIYEGQASLSFGTTATVQITTKKYVEPITFLPGYPAVYPNRFNPEIMLYRGYWTLTWFLNEFCKGLKEEAKESELDKHLREIPAGCNGLFVEPFWSPSLKHPEARGAMIGFTETHTLYHVYKAIIEGINFGLMEGAASLEKKSKTKIKEVNVSGGGARSDEVCQLTANMFGLPVTRMQTHETSGLGAALCAFVGLKVFNSYDEAIKEMVHPSKKFIPDMVEHAVYQNIYENIYGKAYKKMQPLYRSIRKLK